MAFPPKASNSELTAAYVELKNVWKVAERFGMCGQSVHERLTKIGVIDSRRWTKEEDLLLIQLYGRYKESMFMKSIAKELKRSEAAIACRAHELKITNPNRPNSQEQNLKQSESMKTHYATNGVPEYNGMRGKNHTPEAREKMSQASKEQAARKTPEDWVARGEKMVATKMQNGTVNSMRNVSNPYSRTSSGKRADLSGQFFRSCTEANCARYFNLFGYEWEYEPKDFYFEGIRRGSVSYTPDFFVKTKDSWVEVKGWFDSKSITKLKRFKKYYPDEFKKMMLITQSKKTERIAIELGIPYIRYEAIKAKVAHLIPTWEHTK